MPDVQIGADASQAVSAAQQFIASLAQTGTVIKDVTLATTSLNEKQGLLRATFKGTTEANEQAVITIKRVKDELKATLTVTEQKTKKIEEDNKKVDEATKKGNSFLLSLSSIVRLLEAVTVRKLFGDLLSEFSQATQKATEFQIRISEIRTISQQSQLSFKQWAEEIRKVSDAFGFDQADVAKATYEALSNQVARGAESFKFLEESAQFARVAVTTLKNSQDLLSSAINGFGLSTTETGRIAAEFFKTIDLGRVKAEEMANTFGRVAPLAKGLSVSFEDVLATIATLTIQGNKFSDVQTLLTNVLTKLLKPTAEMKALLASWGTPTGEAAISTFGFVGVLTKLQEATRGSTSELAGLFDEIRALKGAGGLTQALGDFSKNKKDIEESSQAYENAIVIANESAGRKIRDEWNKITNFFVNDVGQSLINSFAKINEYIGGLANAITYAAGVVKYLVTGLALLGVGLVATGVASNIGTVGIKAFALNLVTTTSAANGLTASTTALRSIITGGIWTAAALGVGYLASEVFGLNRQFSTTLDYFEKLNGLTLGKVDSKATAPNDKKIEERAKEFTKATDSIFGEAFRILSLVSREVNNNLEIVKRKAVEAGQAFTISSGTFFSVLSERVNDFKRRYTEAKKYIEDSPIRIDKFRESLNEAFTNKVVEYANPEQKIEIYKKRIAEIRADIDALALKGDAKSVQELEKKFSELKDIYTKWFDQYAQEQRKLFPEYSLDVTPLFKSYKELYEYRLAKEAEIIEVQKKQAAEAKAQAEKEAERLKELERLAKEIATFSPTDKAGAVKPEFKGPTGTFDSDKADKALRDLTERFRALAKDAGVVGPEYIKLIVDLEQTIKATRLEIQQQQLAESLKQEQEALKKKKEETIKSYKETLEALSKANAASFGEGQGIDQLKKFAEDFKKFLEERKIQDGLLGALDTGPGSAFSKEGQTKKLNEEGLKQIQELLSKIAALREAGNQINVDGISLPDPAKIQEIKLLVEQLARLQDSYLKSRGEAGSFAFDQKLRDELVQLLNIFDKVKAAQEGLSKQQTGLFGLIDADRLAQLRTQFPLIAEESKKSAEVLIDSFKLVPGAFDPLIEKLQKILDLTKQIAGAKGPGLSFANPIGGELPNPDNTVYLASGGFIGNHPGSAKGEDTIPAWLAPGEFVVNADQTAKFLPVLKAINENRQPRYMAKGGYVSNVGDITVNVNGGSTNERVVRDIGHQLRREIRRGTIRLDGT